MTRVNMGTQDVQGYTGYTVSLGKKWVQRINMGTQDIQGYTGYTVLLG